MADNIRQTGGSNDHYTKAGYAVEKTGNGGPDPTRPEPQNRTRC